MAHFFSKHCRFILTKFVFTDKTMNPVAKKHEKWRELFFNKKTFLHFIMGKLLNIDHNNLVRLKMSILKFSRNCKYCK